VLPLNSVQLKMLFPLQLSLCPVHLLVPLQLCQRPNKQLGLQ
jgi:hypothetical protein